MTSVRFADNFQKIAQKLELQDKNNIAVNGTRVFLLPCQRRCLGSVWRLWLSHYFCHFRRLKKELKQLVSFAFRVECWVCVASWIIPVMQLLPQPYIKMLWMKLLMWPNKNFTRQVRSEHSSDITVNKTTCASAHRAPGKKTAVPIFKVLARPGRESNFRPTSTNADALTTWPCLVKSQNETMLTSRRTDQPNSDF